MAGTLAACEASYYGLDTSKTRLTHLRGVFIVYRLAPKMFSLPRQLRNDL
jgi:hypothetical protein